MALSPRIVIALLALFVAPLNSAQADELNVYVDADFSNIIAVAEAIELGLQTAMAETEHRIAGLSVSVLRKDHRGNPRRSQRNFEAVARDPNAIAVFGGMHSPPYLSFGKQVNADGIPLLLAWSAAAPITRFANGESNFIFRLSVDDAKAGPYLVSAALETGCKEIALVLVDTGWGRVNFETMNAALQAAGLEPAITAMVPSDIGPTAARNLARDIAKSGAQCTVSVLTVSTSVPLFNAMHELNVTMPVLSHWGFISDGFTSQVPHEVREALNLRVLQTCGLNVERAGSPILENAMVTARTLGASVETLRDIAAPAGFVHGYDLGRVFRAAAEQAAKTPEWSQGPVARRKALRSALVDLRTPVEGILMTYDAPFTDLTETARDGHEALGQSQLCLAKFDADDRLAAAKPAPLVVAN